MTAAYVSDVALLLDGWHSADDPASAVYESYAALWARIRSGDPAAFDELVLSLGGPLQHYGRRFVHSADLAQDLVQDVFAHLWTNREHLVIRGSVRGYLYQAIRHRALDLRKRNHAEEQRWTSGGDAGQPAGMATVSYDADEGVYRAEIAARVEAALNTLPPRTREAALLRWRDGLGRAEIAAVMDVAVPTVNNQLTQAARTVRALLADLRESHQA